MQRREHFLKTMLYEELEATDIFKKDPNALIYKDIEEVEQICNKVLNNGEVDVVHMVAPNMTVKIGAVKITYETNDLGFVIPNTCRFNLGYSK